KIKAGTYSVTVALGARAKDKNQFIVDWIDLVESFEVFFTTDQYSFEFFVSIDNKVRTYKIV
ncbi:MAG TPA: hypothetical protein VF810_04970, partial [Patescibacteria group bacterium]